MLYAAGCWNQYIPFDGYNEYVSVHQLHGTVILVKDKSVVVKYYYFIGKASNNLIKVSILYKKKKGDKYSTEQER